MLKSLTRKILRVIKTSISKSEKKLSPLAYWETRAKQYGKRSVLNIAHSEAEVEAVTNMQKEIIFPFLRGVLTGNERLILDFGCGPGRFTPDLAEMIKGKAIGVDPIKHLIDLAPKNKDVEYLLCQEGQIPVADNSIDVVWICLVLGGIKGESLNRTVGEINRVLKVGGLLFLVENTSDKKDGEHWFFRTVKEYNKIFSFVTLIHLQDYYDLGERISILAGRKIR